MMLGSTGEEKAIQTIGCHRDTLVQNADGTRTLRLVMYHDQGNVPQYFSQRTYMSIRTQGLDADSVEIAVNTYDKGVVAKRFKL